MAAGERAHRRAEQERLAAEAAAARAAEAARDAKRQARRDVVAKVLPRRTRSGVQTGALAVRRRQQTGLVIAFVLAVNTLVWLGSSDWAARAFFALLSLFVAPIVVSLVTRK